MLGRQLVLAGVLVAAMAAGAREVTLTAFDRATGDGTVSVSAAEAGDGAKTLLAVWGPSDMGNVATDGRETAVLATVAADDTTKAFTIPERLRAKSGVVRLFLMDGAAPYETRYDWIRSASAGPWIETGVVPTTDIDMSVTAKYPGGTVAPFGVTEVFYLFSNIPSSTDPANYFTAFLGSNNGGAAFTAPRGPGFRTLRLNSTGAYIDGERKVTFDPAQETRTTTSTISLFARKSNGTTTGLTKQGDITISQAWIRDAGTLTHDYMPCRANGVVTLWDRVTRTACTVQGTGSFEAGAELGPLPEDCGTAESATEPLVFGRALAFASRDPETGTVTLSLGESASGGRIYAFAAATDAGTNTVAGWTARTDLGPVADDASTFTAQLPNAWWAAGYAVRFVWVANDGRDYDCALDHIYTAGTAYANTGWIPSLETEIEIRSKSNKDVCSFGIATYFYLFSNGVTFWGFFGKSGSFADYNPASGFHTLKLGPGGVYIDDVRKATISDPTFTALGKATPICFRRANEDGKLSKQGPCWIAWAKIRERDILMQDLIPVMKNGVVGLYDRVWGKFHAPVSGTGAFDAGAVKVEVADGEVLAWSDGVSLALDVNGTWDGGGAGDSFATAANWVGDAVPDLSSGLAALTFANGGSTATVAGPTAVRALAFNAPNDFTIRSANDAAVLALGSGGITILDNPAETLGTWRLAPTFEGRVEVAADQTWDLSTNANRRVQFAAGAVLSGAADRTVTVTGNGVLGLVSTNTFKGSFELRGGLTKVLSKCQPFGAADEGGTVRVFQSGGAGIEFFGATVDKPLIVDSTSLNSDRFVCKDGSGTCTFAAPFTVQGSTFSCQIYGRTVFAGGGTFKTVVNFMRSGDIVFEGRPFTMHAGYDLRIQEKHKIAFNVASNSLKTVNFKADWTQDGNQVDFGVDYAFHNYDTRFALAHKTVLDLHGHSQYFGDLVPFEAGCRIKSDTPAECFAFHNNPAAPSTTYYGTFEGEVCLSKSGLYTVELAARNTSTGYLNDQNGQLVITTNGCWTGTDIRIGHVKTNRKPTLTLLHNACFANPRETTITMTTSSASQIYTADIIPVLKLGEGVNLRVAAIKLDGRTLAGGSWGSSQSAAQHKDDLHFAGTGIIRVPGEGSLFIVR